MRRILTPFLTLMLLSSASALKAGDANKVSPDLQRKLNGPDSRVRVIVQFRDGALDLRKIQDRGGHVTTVLALVKGAAAEMSPAQVSALAADPAVTYISEDRDVYPLLDTAAPAVNAPAAWSFGYDGRGVGVAVIDSGISEVADLKDGPVSRVVYHESFFGHPGDEYGHGTHVAGIIAGNGVSSTGPVYTRTFKGVAPGAHLVDLGVLDGSGVTKDSVVIAALQRAIDLKARYNIRVVNMSLGRPIMESYRTDPLCVAVEAAWKSGLVVVVAAGNLGRNSYATILSPGNSPYALTVGAMKTMGTADRRDDQLATYSSKGPTWLDLVVKPDLVAPGNLAHSLLAPGAKLVRDNPGNVVAAPYYSMVPAGQPAYFTLSGTSAAAPVVSGAAALLLQKDPLLSPDNVKARLMKTASKNWASPDYNLFTVGAGYLDIAAALANRDFAIGSMSPQLVYDAATGMATLVNAASVAWGTPNPWGDPFTWAAPAIWGNNVCTATVTSVAWGTSVSVAWGTSVSVAWGTSVSVAWGTSAVWGTSAAWGTSTAWGTVLIRGE